VFHLHGISRYGVRYDAGNPTSARGISNWMVLQNASRGFIRDVVTRLWVPV
jgi:hypothetical protein